MIRHSATKKNRSISCHLLYTYNEIGKSEEHPTTTTKKPWSGLKRKLVKFPIKIEYFQKLQLFCTNIWWIYGAWTTIFKFFRKNGFLNFLITKIMKKEYLENAATSFTKNVNFSNLSNASNEIDLMSNQNCVILFSQAKMKICSSNYYISSTKLLIHRPNFRSRRLTYQNRFTVLNWSDVWPKKLYEWWREISFDSSSCDLTFELKPILKPLSSIYLL